MILHNFILFRVIQANLGKTPLTYQKCVSLLESLGLPPVPVSAPNSIPSECKAPLEDGNYCIPTLKELGVNENNIGPNLYPGGETEALDRMNRYVDKKVSSVSLLSVIKLVRLLQCKSNLPLWVSAILCNNSVI